MIRVHGELWRAEFIAARSGRRDGRVLRVEGLML